MFYWFLFNFIYNLNAVVTEDVENFFFPSEVKEALIRVMLKSCSSSRGVPADSAGQRKSWKGLFLWESESKYKNQYSRNSLSLL